jgi:alpha-glucosidase
MTRLLGAVLLLARLAAAGLVRREQGDLAYPDYGLLQACPGYEVSNVRTTSSGLTADLTLAGAACNAYGDDLESLRLEVTYETGEFLAGRLMFSA